MKKLLCGVAAMAMLGGVAWADSPAVGNQPASDDKAMAPSTDITSSKSSQSMDVTKDTTTNDAQASNSVEGTVSTIKHDKIMLEGQPEAFYLNDNSTILRDGQVATRSDIKKGADVRVSFDLRDGKKWASTVTLEPSAKPGTFNDQGALNPSDTQNPKY